MGAGVANGYGLPALNYGSETAETKLMTGFQKQWFDCPGLIGGYGIATGNKVILQGSMLPDTSCFPLSPKSNR